MQKQLVIVSFYPKSPYVIYLSPETELPAKLPLAQTRQQTPFKK